MARTDTLGNFLTDVANAIRTKAGTSDTIQASAFDTAIANIPSGDSGWQRPSGWWDTETILANAENKTDSQGVTVYPAYILLLADWDKTTTFSATATNASLRGDGYLTSDGAWYGTPDATHTWDETKDKPCSEGYKTRYVIVYVKGTLSLSINLSTFHCLEMITGNVNLGSYFPNFKKDNSNSNVWIRNFVVSSNTTMTNNNYGTYENFRNCVALENVYIPISNITTIGSNTFYNCYNLKYAYIPYVKTFNSSGQFGNCSSLKKLSFPRLTSIQFQPVANGYSLEEIDLPALQTFSGSNPFQGCYQLKSFKVPSLTSLTPTTTLFGYNYIIDSFTIPSTCTTFPTKSGTNAIFGKYLKNLVLYEDFAINNVDLTDDIGLTHSCLVDMLSKLKDVTGEQDTYTLTLGATNLAKLTNDEIAVGTAKGWTIN